MPNLTKIKQALDEGKVFFENVPVLNPVLLKDYPSGKLPWAVLWRNGDYYFYSHHGGSATKATKTNLSWIINKIFQLTPNQFIKTYELN